jgi:hypothetical protein
MDCLSGAWDNCFYTPDLPYFFTVKEQVLFTKYRRARKRYFKKIKLKNN